MRTGAATATATRDDAARPVVVGVDGSPHSYWAIERGLEEAARLDVGVTLVHAVDQGFSVITPIPGDGFEQLRLGAEAVLRDALSVAEGRGVPLEGVVVYGPPGAALVKASEGASMLVVGSRGRSTCRGPSRASVSSACVRRAGCPLVVVHGLNRGVARAGAS